MDKTLKLLVLVLAAMVAVACAEPPTADVEAADRSLDEARSAQAAEYAPQSLRAAEEQRSQLDAELKAQEERFAMMRDYDKAKELAASTKSSAERATSDAAAARERARQEAADMIAQVRTTIDELKTMLENAPKGKGTEADLAMLQTDLNGMEQSLSEMENAFGEERFLEVKAKAQAVQQSANMMREELQQAMEARAGARR
jgi:hypothetical protein